MLPADFPFGPPPLPLFLAGEMINMHQAANDGPSAQIRPGFPCFLHGRRGGRIKGSIGFLEPIIPVMFLLVRIVFGAAQGRQLCLLSKEHPRWVSFFFFLEM